MFSTFHDELQYIFLEKNFIFMVFLAVKDVGTNVAFEAMQMRFLLFRATKMTQMTSVPASLTAKKSIKMKFFSKKIYRNSS